MIENARASTVPAIVAIVGDEDIVAAQIAHFAEVGPTDFVAAIFGTADERARTYDLMAAIAKQ